MRTDMKKVLTERPRIGHGRSYHDIRARHNRADFDDLPSKEGMRRPYSSHDEERKEFSDLIGPLRRFLHSCKGRRWDDVWSEICAQLSNNTVDSHLKDHVLRDVDLHTLMIDDKVFVNTRYGGIREPIGLYVHPETGLVCGDAFRWWSRHDRTEYVYHDGIAYTQLENGILHSVGNRYDFDRKLIGREKEGFKANGIWYWAVFATVPHSTMRTENGYIKINTVCIDIVTGKHRNTGERYRANKLQMASRDLRRHGLTND
jgi:hypothetical protein